MSQVRAPKSNIRLVDAPAQIPVTVEVGEKPSLSFLIIQHGGRAFRRCQLCGKLSRVARGGSR